jgi:hypothetical protein
MKIKHRYCWLMMTLVFLFWASSCSASTQQPKTVLDYFLLLPNSFFEIDRSVMGRKKWLYGTGRGVVDVKNDYLRMQGDGAQGTLNVALFRHKGKVLVAVQNEFEEGTLSFLRFERGVWKDTTTEVMPLSYNDRNTYIVPRYGTIIRVLRGNSFYDTGHDAKRARLYDFVWTGGRFKVRRYSNQ